MVAEHVIEPENYTENGIVFYKKPWRVKEEDFMNLHGNYSFIASGADSEGMITVYCYASDYDYNTVLGSLFDKEYKDRGLEYYHDIVPLFGGLFL